MENKPKLIFVKDFKELKTIETQLAVSNVELKTASNGKNYIDFLFADKTGTIVGKQFGAFNDTVEEANMKIAEMYESVNVGDVVMVNSKVQEYPPNSGRYSLTLNRFKKVLDYNEADFEVGSKADIDQLTKDFYSMLGLIKDEGLRTALTDYFDKNWEWFSKAPGAKSYHHNYKGGLLEHTVNVMKGCGLMANMYPSLRTDLLYGGAAMHDTGKMQTYIMDGVVIGYTQDGEMYDHLYMSAREWERLVEEYNAVPDRERFTPEIYHNILHMVLTHHGDIRNGWGSVTDPKIPEAIVLHHVDNMIAKAKLAIQRDELQ